MAGASEIGCRCVGAGGAGVGTELGRSSKRLRGSKRRRGEQALQVLTMAGQVLRGVVGQREVAGGDELAAALALLEEVPFAGKG